MVPSLLLGVHKGTTPLARRAVDWSLAERDLSPRSGPSSRRLGSGLVAPELLADAMCCAGGYATAEKREGQRIVQGKPSALLDTTHRINPAMEREPPVTEIAEAASQIEGLDQPSPTIPGVRPRHVPSS